jgi:hypothetical protein
MDLSSFAPRIRVEADVEDALHLVRDLLERVVVPERHGRGVAEVDLRVYGGFFAHDGTSTAPYSFLIRRMKAVEGLSNGMRIRVSPAVSLACKSSARIIGTYRDGRQRMVDQMLAQDALYLASNYDVLGILADDEDYFPAILALSTLSKVPVRWLRQRPTGRNDAHLSTSRVLTLTDSAW